jgi:hypothetical protein
VQEEFYCQFNIKDKVNKWEVGVEIKVIYLIKEIGAETGDTCQIKEVGVVIKDGDQAKVLGVEITLIQEDKGNINMGIITIAIMDDDYNG